jgi:predicted AlkP superfamily pyrophosphatase or phosphodiesterase
MVENNEAATRIILKLDIEAVPMDVREFNRNEYREVFPQGTVKTPIGEVKIGKNQFEKMAEKDNGKRRSLIGAMRQTLADPIVIILEEKDGRKAYLFIKSFKNMKDSRKPDFIMSVVVTIDDTKIAISTYKRKRREVLSKIKRAGVIAYEKNYGTSLTNGIKPAI